MSEEKIPQVSTIELHEEFIQHMERGGGRMRSLALVTIVVAFLLAVSYFSQLVILPFALGVTSQTVNLLDPSLMTVEAVVLFLTLLWFYVGVREYLFAKRMAKQIEEIRETQAKLGEKYKLGT